MRTEAEYYGIQKIVDHIDYLEEKKRQEESQQPGKPSSTSCLLLWMAPYVNDKDFFICCCCCLFQAEQPYLNTVGCYVDDVDKNAFMFGERNKLTLVSGDQAFTQALVRRNIFITCVVAFIALRNNLTMLGKTLGTDLVEGKRH